MWVYQPLLPSPCTRSDAELLLHHVGESQSGLEFVGSVVFTKAFLTSCLEHFGPIIKERAQKVGVQSNKSVVLMHCILFLFFICNIWVILLKCSQVTVCLSSFLL